MASCSVPFTMVSTPLPAPCSRANAAAAAGPPYGLSVVKDAALQVDEGVVMLVGPFEIGRDG